MATVRAYFNTDFNGINIPDKPSLLDNMQFRDFPAIEVLQTYVLPYIDISATWPEVRNLDYIRITSEDALDGNPYFYYSVDAVVMTSADVARLTLTPDFLTSAGGAENLNYLDGVVERWCVDDDSMFKYTEEDPLIFPAQSMNIESHYESTVTGTVIPPQATLIECTADPYYTRLAPNGKTYEDSTTGNSVTVPQLRPTIGETDIGMEIVPNSADTDLDDAVANGHAFNTRLPASAIYAPSFTFTYSGSGIETLDIYSILADLRSLGLESVVLSQYQVPYDFIKDEYTSRQPYDYNTEEYAHITGANSGEYKTLTAKARRFPINDIPFAHHYATAPKNNRVLYGKFTEYHLTAVASGNEAVYDSSELESNGSSYPTVVGMADLRSEGCPYYRFEYYNGNNDPQLFFQNCVRGMNWPTAPIAYATKSGSYFDQYKFESNRQLQYNEFQRNLQNQKDQQAYGNVQRTTQAITAGGLLSGNIAGAIGAGISSIITGVMENAMLESQREREKQSFNEKAQLELENFAIGQVTAPEIKFPRTEAMRDFIGNGFLVWRTYYTDDDKRRIDRLLTMYGYRHTRPLSEDCFTSRTKFNYVKASGVSVRIGINGQNLPKYMRDGIASQLSAGVRVWHKQPSELDYISGNPIV